ncbi:MAG TPA: hypothetical protein VKZ18_11165 [Polyangia bacterium]|nr:hypothetical protein [Polyangia bacterium]
MAHNPAPAPSPTRSQLGCFQVLEDRSADIDLPPSFRQDIPARVALTLERDDKFPLVPGWRLAALGDETAEARRALRDGSWWPLENGGVQVQFGDGTSGVGLSLAPSGTHFEGEARTYSAVGDHWFHTPVRLDRIACPSPPTMIARIDPSDQR